MSRPSTASSPKHSTRLVFGDYVSVYRMRQAQEDHATVPIYYESRQVPVLIDDPEELRRVEAVLEGEEENPKVVRRPIAIRSSRITKPQVDRRPLRDHEPDNVAAGYQVSSRIASRALASAQASSAAGSVLPVRTADVQEA